MNSRMESPEHASNVEAVTFRQFRDLLATGSLLKRQTAVLAIPTTYTGLHSDLPPGTVAGIVVGSVAGFLLLLWILYTCFGLVNPFAWGRSTVVEEEVIRRRSLSSHHRSRSRHETVILEER